MARLAAGGSRFPYLVRSLLRASMPTCRMAARSGHLHPRKAVSYRVVKTRREPASVS
ncbi:hypothetical protein CKAH01_11323 [Colletotrichum kahawae]|uniref:Uncharacterized protein n=1 Tax=Colletotrichum kahawae TaxID=34407 RepID=A0AAD9YU37_COLKA|nr:hypothetical protein CKAH01_11323 [Colletotrichum kahawae]